MHSDKIIASRRALLFQEAVKALRTAGIDGEDFEHRMKSLDILIDEHLSSDGNRDAKSAKPKSQSSTKKPPPNAEPENAHVDFVYEDGTEYSGQILNGLPDGEGTIRWPDGSTYSGTFTEGEIHGYGTQIGPEGDEYVGHFIKGKRHGDGALKRADGHSYSGGWSNGEYHGHGKHVRRDGAIIEGQHLNGHVDGYATETLTDGSAYVGEWKYSQRHGHGTFTKKSGAVFTGPFKHGSYSPQRTITSKAMRALVVLLVSFLTVTIYQSWARGVGVLSLLDDRLVQLESLLTGQESEPINEAEAEVASAAPVIEDAPIETQEGVMIEGVDDLLLPPEDIAVLEAAIAGDVDAQVEAAQIMYQSNSSVAMGLARDYLKAAASQGSANALEELGMMYFTGALGEPDLARSYAALTLAEMDGEPVSAASFDRLVNEMTAPQMVQAQSIIQDCLTKGVSQCQF